MSETITLTQDVLQNQLTNVFMVGHAQGLSTILAIIHLSLWSLSLQPNSDSTRVNTLCDMAEIVAVHIGDSTYETLVEIRTYGGWKLL